MSKASQMPLLELFSVGSHDHPLPVLKATTWFIDYIILDLGRSEGILKLHGILRILVLLAD